MPDYASPIMAPPHKPSFAEKLMMTWPVELAKSLYSAAMLPGDVYTGKTQVMDPNTGHVAEDVIGRSADLAGGVTLGSGALPGAANEARMGIRAYHGSPHDFDKFDISKIGTGEGAQAYGHGLYFAENEGVAKQYADDLAKLNINDTPWVDDPTSVLGAVDRETKAAAKLIQDHGYEEALQIAEREFAKDKGDVWAHGLLQSVKDLQGKSVALQRKMYEVSINAHPDEFLDWDKPLSEQPQKVRDALDPQRMGLVAKTVENNGQKYTGWVDSQGRVVGRYVKGETPPTREQIFHPQESAQGLYRGTIAGDDHARATEYLRAAGIKGIRYKDAGSRGADAAGGTHNYVVFDDKIIDILKKYGLAGLTAGLGGAAAMGNQSMTPEQFAAFQQGGGA